MNKEGAFPPDSSALPDMRNVLVFGKTGVGKTTTLNTLFGLHWPIDHAVACTKAPAVRLLTQQDHPDLLTPMRVVDLPGIGESLAKDEEYWPYYAEWVPCADHLLWITQADTRAYRRDELFLTRLMGMLKPAMRLTIGLNKADCLGFDEGHDGFDYSRRQLSAGQLEQLPAKVDDVFALFARVLEGRLEFGRDDIVPYSATSGWGVVKLRRLFFT
jgi:uncharacterized protein